MAKGEGAPAGAFNTIYVDLRCITLSNVEKGFHRKSEFPVTVILHLQALQQDELTSELFDML
jgi:hypothetical protein